MYSLCQPRAAVKQLISIRGCAHKNSAKTNEGKHSFFDFTL
jgi:hypothetical protein